MRIDLVSTESWEDLNDKIKMSLSLGQGQRVRAYHGLAHGTYEIVQSAAQFMSHKKAVGAVLGQTPAFDGLLPYFYKETYTVQAIRHMDLLNVPEWVESLKKDTNFVIFAEDHPVTGEKYSFVEELDQELNKKRIGSFRISHTNHFFHSIEIRPYTVRLCSYDTSAALAVLGERYKAPSLMAPRMGWDQDTFIQKLQNCIKKQKINRERVIQFEKEISSISRPFFGTSENRIFDRAVCVFPEVNASALSHLILQKMGIADLEGNNKIATTNLCFWISPKMFDQWWLPAPRVNDLRGLLIFSEEILGHADFSKLVLDCHQELVDQQSWSV